MLVVCRSLSYLPYFSSLWTISVWVFQFFKQRGYQTPRTVPNWWKKYISVWHCLSSFPDTVTLWNVGWFKQPDSAGSPRTFHCIQSPRKFENMHKWWCWLFKIIRRYFWNSLWRFDIKWLRCYAIYWLCGRGICRMYLKYGVYFGADCTWV
jgi:hypothetical protein